MFFKDFKFPEPQYLGSKYKLLPWINKHIPKNINTTLDAFSGSQSVSYFFKQLGFKVISNDFLNFNNQIGKSLVENKSIILDQNDINFLLNHNNKNEYYDLIENTYTDIFFERDESKFLDNFRYNISLLDNDYKKSLAFTIINRSMTRKITMGHFGHTQALVYSKDPERIKRNRSLIRPLRDIFLDLVDEYNNSVFDNTKDNISYNNDILELLPNLGDIDLAYFDPPYCDSHADYQGFYHLLETYTEYWKDKDFINKIKRYEPKRISGFDKKKESIKSLKKLFECSVNIPYWLISYNNRSYPCIEDFTKIISKYREVNIETMTYKKGRGGKGSVAGSKEILFICKPKKLVFKL